MTERICPVTGAVMVRGYRDVVLKHKRASITVSMPGWYPYGSDEGVHSGEDMEVSDRALNRLKARVEGLLEPEDVMRPPLQS